VFRIAFKYANSPGLALTVGVVAALVYGIGMMPQARAAALNSASVASSPVTIAVIGDYGCDTVGSTCAAASSNTSAVANLVHSWSPDAIWTVGDNSYQWGCVGPAGFTNATNHNCAYPDQALSTQTSGTVGTGSTNTALVAGSTSPTPADRWANDWYNNETITVNHNGTNYTGVVGNKTEPTPYHLYLKTGFSGGYVPQAGDTFTVTPFDDVGADQSPYAADIAAGKLYSVPGNHDATNMNDLIYGGSTANPGAYCPHQNDGSNYYSGHQNCGYLFNRPTHYTAGFGSDGNGHDLVDFFALDTRGTDPDGAGLGSKQYADYQNDLANSTAVWKIEAQHEPNWSSGEFGPYANTNTAYAGQNTNWTIDSSIDLFLSGHDHDMEQIYGNDATNTVTGKTFMVMGTGGKSADPFTKPACPFQGIAGINDCNSASGYPYTVWRGDDSSTYGSSSEQVGALKLTISTTQLKAQYVAVDGTVLHSYSLYKSGAAEVRGTITDADTSSPIVGAKVSYSDGDVFTGTADSANGAGVYDFRDGIPAGTTLTVTAPGYQTSTMTVSSVPNMSANLALRPRTGLFADSFESGDLSKWDSRSVVPPAICGPAATPSCAPNIGSYAADFKTVSPQAGGVQLTKGFSSASATVDERSYFNIRSASTNATLFYFRTSTNGAMWHAYLDYLTGRIGIRTDAGTAATYPGCNQALPTTYPWSHYHSVEAKTVVAPSGNSTIQIWVDGQPETLPGPDGVCNTADDTSIQPAFVGNTKAGKVILGDTAASRTFDFWADDVAVNSSYLGSAWGSLHGHLTDATTGTPIAGASVTVAYTANNWGTPPSTTTNANGNYTITNLIANQDLNITISATNYVTQTPTVNMPFDGNVTYDSQLALMQGVVNGTVTDASTGTPLQGVTITGPEDVSTVTDNAGHYSFATDPGQVTFTASMPGYSDSTATVNVPYGGAAVTQNYALTPASGTIFGTVTGVDGTTPVSGATVGISGGPSTTTDANGNYTLTGVPAGTSQTVTASSSGYISSSAVISLPSGGTFTQNYLLKKILFSDNFETGSFASWTSNVKLVICTSSLSGCPHLGTYGAEGTASGTTVAYATRKLSTPTAEIYFRAYVYLRSQGSNNVTLLQVANSSGAPIAHVFINSAHQLGLRNDYALTTAQSTRVVSAGTWHVLEFHVKVNGTAATTGVYLDGSAIPALSSTSANLGPSNVAAVWIGENQANRTYDLLYDDAMAADGYIGP
jgi:Carboxypeptidase regulatory-like domain/Calcineurin-like phosphoesterase